MMAATRRDIPHGFHHATTYGDILIPAIHHDILLAAVQEELIAYLERHGAIGAQHDLLRMERLNGDARHPLPLRQYASRSRQRPHSHIADGDPWPWRAGDRPQDLSS